MTEELKQIKKDYGEKMMQICRRNFATILDTPGVLYEILSKHIAPTHTLADDLDSRSLEEEFKYFVSAFLDKKERELVDTNKSPFELMNEAGYILHECKTENEIQSYKHYYKSGEELCTFHGDRLNRCRVFFAVKKDANLLNRDDFKEPKREDPYGTSVISIQFSRGFINTLSIKNRYNHTVDNPDATFFNNLENIIPGLTKSFEKAYRLNIISETNDNCNFLIEYLPYTVGYIPPKDENGNEIEIDDKEKLDKKFYRFNVEHDNIYYCENNIIIKDGKVIDKYSKDGGRYIIIDNYVLDTHEKTIYPFAYKGVIVDEMSEDDSYHKDDAFTQSIKEVGDIKNITVEKNNGNRIIKIKYVDGKEVYITIDKTNSIISYKNEYIKVLHEGFLFCNRKLKELSVDNVETVEAGCLPVNGVIEEVTLPNAKYIGPYSFQNSSHMKKFIIPNALELGDCVLEGNIDLEELIAPSLRTIGTKVLFHNLRLNKLLLNDVRVIGSYFVHYNQNDWKIINMPSLLRMEKGCFSSIRCINAVHMDSVEEIGPYCFYSEEYLRELYLPNVIIIYEGFMDANHSMEYFIAPQLERMEKGCFSHNPGMLYGILDCLEKHEPCEVHVNTRLGM